MAIRNAIDLLKDIDENSELRFYLYGCSGSVEMHTYLRSKGYSFDIEEFEEAVRLKHVLCQTLEDAQELLHKADWLRYLMVINEKNAS
jgi:hypothetical protein